MYAYNDTQTHTLSLQDLKEFINWAKKKKKHFNALACSNAQDLFAYATYLSFRDISNYLPITLPLYAATLWHFHKTFASVRKHDGLQLKAC